MSKVTVYVGLDYHKDSIQVCTMDAAGKVLVNRSCRNDALAVARLVATQADHVRGAIDLGQLRTWGFVPIPAKRFNSKS